MKQIKKGFTLAEILITLAIIGVVAAMTIPTLIAKINEKVTENQTKVFKAKIIKGLNLTKAAGELNNTYTSTKDFLENGLSKHFKITKICGPNEMRNCVPYDNINYIYNDTDDVVAVKDIDTAEELNLKEEDGFKDIASFVTGDGTVVITSYKLDCLVDDGELDKDISPCLAGIYDLNGTRKPNKLGKDLLTFNGATLNIDHGPAVLATVGGVKIISAAQVPTPMTKAECNENKSKYGINGCSYDDDYWASAMKTCQDLGGRLPTDAELTKIAQELYNDTSITNAWKGDLTLDTSKIPPALSGLGTSWYSLWSTTESNVYDADFRTFTTSSTSRQNGWRKSPDSRTVCVAD